MYFKSFESVVMSARHVVVGDGDCRHDMQFFCAFFCLLYLLAITIHGTIPAGYTAWIAKAMYACCFGTYSILHFVQLHIRSFNVISILINGQSISAEQQTSTP